MTQKRYNAAPKSGRTPTAGRAFDLPRALSPQRWARQLAPRARAASPAACGVFLSRLAFILAASSSSARAIVWAARVLRRSGVFQYKTTLGCTVLHLAGEMDMAGTRAGQNWPASAPAHIIFVDLGAFRRMALSAR